MKPNESVGRQIYDIVGTKRAGILLQLLAISLSFKCAIGPRMGLYWNYKYYLKIRNKCCISIRSRLISRLAFYAYYCFKKVRSLFVFVFLKWPVSVVGGGGGYYVCFTFSNASRKLICSLATLLSGMDLLNCNFHNSYFSHV